MQLYNSALEIDRRNSTFLRVDIGKTGPRLKSEVVSRKFFQVELHRIKMTS